MVFHSSTVLILLFVWILASLSDLLIISPLPMEMFYLHQSCSTVWNESVSTPRQHLVKIKSGVFSVFWSHAFFQVTWENNESHGFQREKCNCSYLFTSWLAMGFSFVWDCKTNMQCLGFNPMINSQQNCKKKRDVLSSASSSRFGASKMLLK